MTFWKFNSVSVFSLAGFVLLIGGLGVAIVAAQQQQETKSHAATMYYEICKNGKTVDNPFGPYGDPKRDDCSSGNDCCSGKCGGGGATGNCTAEATPACLTLPGGGKCKKGSSCATNENSVSNKGCASGFTCCTPKPSNCVSNSSYSRACRDPRSGCASGYVYNGSLTCGGGSPNICCQKQNPPAPKTQPKEQVTDAACKAVGGTCGKTCTGDKPKVDSSKKCPGFETGSRCCIPDPAAPKPEPKTQPNDQPPSGNGGSGTSKGPSCTSQGGKCKYSSCTKDETYVSASCDGSAYMVCCKANPPTPTPKSSGGGGKGGGGNTPAATVPTPATNVTATCASTSLTVNWKPVAGFDNYYVFIYDETAYGPTLYDPEHTVSSGPSSVTGNSFTFNNMTAGHTYSYWTNTTTPAGSPSSDPAPTPYTAKVTCGGSSGGTIFNLNLLFHGVGKGGDNRNANGGGNTKLKHATRDAVVSVYDLNDKPVVQGVTGQVKFDSALGGYKGQIAMGSALATGSYVIKVKLTHSLWGKITRNITAGTTNEIPVMSLVSGDTNNSGQLDILDYNLIIGCYSDFGQPPLSCDDTKKAQADIDDDGEVNQFDLNLFLREMSVQQ